jgi:hypothetical protein
VLKAIEAKRPELCPLFFEVDLASCMLESLRRDDDGRCCQCDELMKGVEPVDFTTAVYYWFATVPYLLRAVHGILFVLRTKWQLAEDAAGSASPTQQDLAGRTLAGEDSPARWRAHVHPIFGLFMAIFLSGLFFSKVLWPKSLEGELPRHDIDYCSNGHQVLITWQAMGAALSSSSSY